MTRLVKLDIPPGVYKNGTEYEAAGRWHDSSLVRWREGAMRPVGGWNSAPWTAGAYTDLFDETFVFQPGAIAWVDNSGNKWALFSQARSAFVYDVANERTYDLTAGYVSQGQWTWDTFGEIPVGCHDVNGEILELDLNTNNLTQVTNSPSNCDAVVVADERFIFALGAGGEKDRVEWSDRDNRAVWTAADTNQAGGFTLDTEGEILFGLQMRGEMLFVTTTDCWTAAYVGYPDVWSFRRIGSCTAINRNCGVRSGDSAYWMGDGEFYRYHGGFVQRIPCDVSDHVFGEINLARNNHLYVFAWDNVEHGEVWWQYSNDGGSNYGKATQGVSLSTLEGHWGLHTGLQAAAVAPRGVTDNPLASLHSIATTGSTLLHDYSIDPGYSLATNWQITGGTLNQSSPTASQASFSTTGNTVGVDRLVKIVVQNRTVGTLSVNYGGTSVDLTANGTYWFVATVDGTTMELGFLADGTWDGEVDLSQVRVPIVGELELSTEWYYGGATPYAETGPLEIGIGEKRAHVLSVLPDERDAGELQLTFKTREYPTGTETTHAAVTTANPTDVRFSGRQFTMRVEPASTNTDWRSGNHRLSVVDRGRR